MVSKFKLYALLTSAIFLFQIHTGYAGKSNNEDNSPKTPTVKSVANAELLPRLQDVQACIGYLKEIRKLHNDHYPGSTMKDVHALIYRKLVCLTKSIEEWKRENGVTDYWVAPQLQKDMLQTTLSFMSWDFKDYPCTKEERIRNRDEFIKLCKKTFEEATGYETRVKELLSKGKKNPSKE